MIAMLNGKVLDIRLNQLIVDVSGIGYQVLVAPEVAAEARIGEMIALHTSLVVREESWTLFGFLSLDAKELFTELQSVTGIGPKVASALLAVYGPEELKVAIGTQDHAALERVPGIGKKVASRIILELKDKFAGGYKSKNSFAVPWRNQVIGALTGLGYSNKEAEAALDEVLTSLGRTPTESDLPEMLKLALARSRRSS